MSRLAIGMVAAILFPILMTICHGFEETRQILDDMTAFHEGPHKNFYYPSDHWKSMEDCFAQWDDPLLLAAQDASWRAFYDYYVSNGNAPIPGDDLWAGSPSRYQERKDDKAAMFGGEGRYPYENGVFQETYLVVEPCNFASNVAYYRAMTAVCQYDESFAMPVAAKRALKQSLATLAVGSAWWHGSNTQVGLILDNGLIAVHLNNVYRIMVEPLPSRTTPRVLQSLRTDVVDAPDLAELNHNISHVFLNEPISKWGPTLENLPIRIVYEETVLASYSLVCAMALRLSTCERILRCLWIPLFNDDEDILKDFLLDDYFPALYDVVEQENFPIVGGLGLLGQTHAIIANFAWGLLWQELVLPVPFRRYLARFGNLVANSVDSILNSVGGYDIPDDRLSARSGVYPGADTCNKQSPHALWHQESADVMWELTRLTDDVRVALQKHRQSQQ